MTVKNIFFLILLFVTIVVTSVYFLFNGTPWGKLIMKIKAHNYLEEKYSQEMKVKNVEYSFKTSAYFVTAYLKENPRISFMVYPTNKITDSFITSYWKYEVESELDPLVKKVFDKSAKGKIIISNNFPMDDEFYKNGEVLSYHQVKSEIKETKSRDIEIFISLHRFFDERSYDEYRMMYDVIKYIKGKYEADFIEFCYCGDVRVDSADKWTIFKIPDEKLDVITSYEDIRQFREK